MNYDNKYEFVLIYESFINVLMTLWNTGVNKIIISDEIIIMKIF